LKEVELHRESKMSNYERFNIYYIYTRANKPLPAVDVYCGHGDGVVMSANHLTEEIVDILRKRGMKIGVWNRLGEYEEDGFYEMLFKNKINMVISD
jgi:hypothetical protein